MLESEHSYRQHPGTPAPHPDLDYVVPPPLRIFKRCLQAIPHNRLLSALLDGASFLYAPRAGLGLLRKAGYADCFRSTNLDSPGFTYPSTAPAGRIDFIFASADLARRLTACDVVGADTAMSVLEASDHLPVLAEFGREAQRLKEE